MHPNHLVDGCQENTSTVAVSRNLMTLAETDYELLKLVGST
jgi:hypothetical protein